MAPAKNNLQSSIAGDSVFDWGFTERRNSRDGGPSGVGSAVFLDAPGDRREEPAASPPSRYDPGTMARIVDINDLVDDGEDSDDDDFEPVEEYGMPRPAPLNVTQDVKAKKKLRHRRVAMLTAITAVIIATAAAVAYVVVNPEDRVEALRLRPVKTGEGREGTRQQLLLETAERVAEACDVSAKDGDLGRCWELCEKKECCFDEEDSCEDDEEANCAAYAGCLALRAGAPLDAMEEDVERKDRR